MSTAAASNAPAARKSRLRPVQSPPLSSPAAAAAAPQPPPAAVAAAPFKRAVPGKVQATAALGDEKKREVVRQGFEKKAGLAKSIAEQLELGILKVSCPNGETLTEGSEQYKEYKAQYKRLSTHLRQNKSLSKRLKLGELSASGVAAMADKDLMTEVQRKEIEQFAQEGLREALGERVEDTCHWFPSKDYVCTKCESGDCLYIQNFSGGHGYDDKEVDAAITIRCKDCHHLWKEDSVDGGRLAAGSEGYTTGAELLAASTERPEVWRDDFNGKKVTWMLPA